MQNGNPHDEVEKDPNDQEEGGFEKNDGPKPGEVDPAGPGSEDLTDQEDGTGFGDQEGPGEGEVDPAAPERPDDPE